MRITYHTSQQPAKEPPDPRKIVFGRTFTPHMFMAEYRAGSWQDARIAPLQNFSLHPAAMVFHYAQAIFEGLKAFEQPDGSVALFRPEMNARRFNASARRMAMPCVDEELFLDAASGLVQTDRASIPPYPGSLYIRPAMIATEACLGVKSSSEFTFFILTLPAGLYFPEVASGAGAIEVLVSESVVRAAPGGTGNVKAAANYAVTLQILSQAKSLNCPQVLFLDTSPSRHVEEMGGMNVMFIEDGALVTPPLTQTILAGVTRDTVLHLAREMQLSVREHAYGLEEMADGLKIGRISEAIACGTAAVVTGIRAFHFENGTVLPVGKTSPGPITNALFNRLQDIQYGRVPDKYGWVVPVQGVRTA
jgi:branched-chain amino acid aminotransferase